ncbi:MAG: hypothetical protein Q4D96_09810 [Propionibacteriaceae bacterium]|nr:hypothetical protein [Propionibacteriaceae bacterium]
MVFLTLGAARLGMVLTAFLIFWLTGWVPVGTAALISGLLGLVVVGATGHEVFISSKDRPGIGFLIVVPTLMVVCFAIPLWGTDKLWPAILGSATTGVILSLLQSRHRRGAGDVSDEGGDCSG